MCEFFIYVFDSIIELLCNQTFWTAVAAIGTITVSWLAAFPKKEKEIIEGWYWFLGTTIRVLIINKSNCNCTLEKGSYLLITCANRGEFQSKPLELKRVIPAHFECNIHYLISEDTYKMFQINPHMDIFLFTEKGTVIKLNRGIDG